MLHEGLSRVPNHMCMLNADPDIERLIPYHAVDPTVKPPYHEADVISMQ